MPEELILETEQSHIFHVTKIQLTGMRRNFLFASDPIPGFNSPIPHPPQLQEVWSLQRISHVNAAISIASIHGMPNPFAETRSDTMFVPEIPIAVGDEGRGPCAGPVLPAL